MSIFFGIESIEYDAENCINEQIKRIKTLYLSLKKNNIQKNIIKIIILKSKYAYSFILEKSNELLLFGYNTNNLLNKFVHLAQEIIEEKGILSKIDSCVFIRSDTFKNLIHKYIIHKYPFNDISKGIKDDKFYTLALLNKNKEAIEFYNKNIKLNNINSYARDLCKHDKFKNIKYSCIDKNKIDYTYVVIGYCEAELYDEALYYYKKYNITSQIIDLLIDIDCDEFLRIIYKDFKITDNHAVDMITYEQKNCINFILFESDIKDSFDFEYITNKIKENIIFPTLYQSKIFHILQNKIK